MKYRNPSALTTKAVAPGTRHSFGRALVVLLGSIAACDGQQLALSPTVCTPGEIVCDDACSALSKDPENCGACGTVCGAGTVCYAGTCATSCGGGTAQCGQSCVDLQSDRDDCGACGTACGPGLVCEGGQCTSSCADAQKLCVLDGGAAYCANTASDNDNCGACGVACGPEQVCSGSACGSTCVGGQTFCNVDGGQPYCASIQTDNANCGACGVACGPQQVCSGGACGTTCVGGQTFCDVDGGAPYCASVQTDNANCGTCATTCPTGQTCVAGACEIQCSPGLTLCGSECVDTMTESSHCGACGTTCDGTCVGGHCVVELAIAQDPIQIAMHGYDISWVQTTVGSEYVYDRAAYALTTETVLDIPTSQRDIAGGPTGAVCWSHDGYEPSVMTFYEGTYAVVAYDDTIPNHVAVDTNNVYWTTVNGGAIRRAPLSGGSPTTMIESVDPRAIATNGTDVFWVNGTTNPSILSLPVTAVDGDTPVSVTSGGGPRLRADASNVYWRSVGVHQVPTGGGTVIDLSSDPALGLAIDGFNVYFFDVNSETLSRVPIGGGTVTTVVDLHTFGVPSGDTLEVDAKAVFLQTDAEIIRVTPK